MLLKCDLEPNAMKKDSFMFYRRYYTKPSHGNMKKKTVKVYLFD